MARQWLRHCKLTVEGRDGGFDLSAFRIRFRVKRNNLRTPNYAEVIVTNLKPETERAIQKAGADKVLTIEGGYEENPGIIFKGQIMQAARGRESAVDTYLHLVARDGGQAYDYATVNRTLSAGSTYKDQVEEAVRAMEPYGVKLGFVADLGSRRAPRAVVMFGMARDLLDDVAKATSTRWSIQNGQLEVVKETGDRPEGPVEINSSTGMVGRPTETLGGVEVVCLMNPRLHPDYRIRIDQSRVNELQLSGNAFNDQAGDQIRELIRAADGVYKIFAMQHTGDTRGNDWYTELLCIRGDGTYPAQYAVSGIPIPGLN
jgi:hypothetical protein